MKFVVQRIKILYENGINYQKLNESEIYNEVEKSSKISKIINSQNDFIDKIKMQDGIFIITGSNGVGKSHLLNYIYDTFNCEKNIKLIKLKEIDTYDKFIYEVSESNDFLLLDGLDEINGNIFGDLIKYIFNINHGKVILSGRMDFLQKNNMLNEKNNIYEILPLDDNCVNNILEQYKIPKGLIEGIFHILKIPRFLNYVIEIKDDICANIINKYDILNILVDRHLETLNGRAVVKLEKNIHKKILQTMALVMMMSGKMNLSIEDFIILLNKVKSLDVKSYILTKDLIDSFLCNQLLINDGNFLCFENKEIMEFLAAKEIIENNFSNIELYNIVVFGNEIDSLWFNVITYLCIVSSDYKKLILDYVRNNLVKQDGLLDLVLSIDINCEYENFFESIILDIVYKYTELRQYIPLHEDNMIFKILSHHVIDCFDILIDEFISKSFVEDASDFETIYINNIMSCINHILCTNKEKIIITDRFVQYILDKEFYFMNSKKFYIRYFYIYLHVFSVDVIDDFISRNLIIPRLLSIFLYSYDDVDKLKNLDIVINKFIASYGDKTFDNHIYINPSKVSEYINKNYNYLRLKNMIISFSTEKSIFNFLKFMNNDSCSELWKLFDSKRKARLLYNYILKKIIDNKLILTDDILFSRSHGKSFSRIIDLNIKYGFISANILKNMKISDYISDYVYDMFIKHFLVVGDNYNEIFSILSEKDKLFYVWRNDLNDNFKNKYLERIQVDYNVLYHKYLDDIQTYKNKEIDSIKGNVNKCLNSNNIYYIIDNIYNIMCNDSEMAIVNLDEELNDSLSKIINKIAKYFNDIDVSKLFVEYNYDSNTYNMSYEFLCSYNALFILKKSGIDINKYNEKNIILLNFNNDDVELDYSESDYQILISYLKSEKNIDYVKVNLNSIIQKLEDNHIDELYSFVFNWIEEIEFDEFDVNTIIEFLCKNIERLSDEKLPMLEKFNELKRCQDLLIMKGIDTAIEDRINYIKRFLVVEGDLFDKGGSNCFEYSSGDYSMVLANIGIEKRKYIIDFIRFAFEKYNSGGDYYYFTKYILDMVFQYVKNNIRYSQIEEVIKLVLELEKNSKDRLLYNTCKPFTTLKSINVSNINEVVKKLNTLFYYNKTQIYSYNDLFNVVSNIISNDILSDIKRMKFFEVFKYKTADGKIEMPKLLEETYQFIIGYELSRRLLMEGYSTKVFYETTGYDKKRSDITLVTEGFIQNIVIETKLSNNNDLSNCTTTKKYINDTLSKYRDEFNSPKLFFVIINQNCKTKTCKTKIDWIYSSGSDFVVPILIDVKEEIKKLCV